MDCSSLNLEAPENVIRADEEEEQMNDVPGPSGVQSYVEVDNCGGVGRVVYDERPTGGEGQEEYEERLDELQSPLSNQSTLECPSCKNAQDNAAKAYEVAQLTSAKILECEQLSAEVESMRSGLSENTRYIEELLKKLNDQANELNDKTLECNNEKEANKRLTTENQKYMKQAKESEEHLNAANEFRAKYDLSQTALKDLSEKKTDLVMKLRDAIKLTEDLRRKKEKTESDYFKLRKKMGTMREAVNRLKKPFPVIIRLLSDLVEWAPSSSDLPNALRNRLVKLDLDEIRVVAGQKLPSSDDEAAANIESLLLSDTFEKSAEEDSNGDGPANLAQDLEMSDSEPESSNSPIKVKRGADAGDGGWPDVDEMSDNGGQSSLSNSPVKSSYSRGGRVHYGRGRRGRAGSRRGQSGRGRGRQLPPPAVPVTEMVTRSRMTKMDVPDKAFDDMLERKLGRSANEEETGGASISTSIHGRKTMSVKEQQSIMMKNSTKRIAQLKEEEKKRIQNQKKGQDAKKGEVEREKDVGGEIPAQDGVLEGPFVGIEHLDMPTNTDCLTTPVDDDSTESLERMVGQREKTPPRGETTSSHREDMVSPRTAKRKEKLIEAGLDLSDSESEEEAMPVLKRKEWKTAEKTREGMEKKKTESDTSGELPEQTKKEVERKAPHAVTKPSEKKLIEETDELIVFDVVRDMVNKTASPWPVPKEHRWFELDFTTDEYFGQTRTPAKNTLPVRPRVISTSSVTTKPSSSNLANEDKAILSDRPKPIAAPSRVSLVPLGEDMAPNPLPKRTANVPSNKAPAAAVQPEPKPMPKQAKKAPSTTEANFLSDILGGAKHTTNSPKKAAPIQRIPTLNAGQAQKIVPFEEVDKNVKEGKEVVEETGMMQKEDEELIQRRLQELADEQQSAVYRTPAKRPRRASSPSTCPRRSSLGRNQEIALMTSPVVTRSKSRAPSPLRHAPQRGARASSPVSRKNMPRARAVSTVAPRAASTASPHRTASTSRTSRASQDVPPLASPPRITSRAARAATPGPLPRRNAPQASMSSSRDDSSISLSQKNAPRTSRSYARASTPEPISRSASAYEVPPSPRRVSARLSKRGGPNMSEAVAIPRPTPPQSIQLNEKANRAKAALSKDKPPPVHNTTAAKKIQTRASDPVETDCVPLRRRTAPVAMTAHRTRTHGETEKEKEVEGEEDEPTTEEVVEKKQRVARAPPAKQELAQTETIENEAVVDKKGKEPTMEVDQGEESDGSDAGEMHIVVDNEAETEVASEQPKSAEKEGVDETERREEREGQEEKEKEKDVPEAAPLASSSTESVVPPSLSDKARRAATAISSNNTVKASSSVRLSQLRNTMGGRDITSMNKALSTLSKQMRKPPTTKATATIRTAQPKKQTVKKGPAAPIQKPAEGSIQNEEKSTVKKKKVEEAETQRERPAVEKGTVPIIPAHYMRGKKRPYDAMLSGQPPAKKSAPGHDKASEKMLLGYLHASLGERTLEDIMSSIDLSIMDLPVQVVTHVFIQVLSEVDAGDMWIALSTAMREGANPEDKCMSLAEKGLFAFLEQLVSNNEQLWQRLFILIFHRLCVLITHHWSANRIQTSRNVRCLFAVLTCDQTASDEEKMDLARKAVHLLLSTKSSDTVLQCLVFVLTNHQTRRFVSWLVDENENTHLARLLRLHSAKNESLRSKFEEGCAPDRWKWPPLEVATVQSWWDQSLIQIDEYAARGGVSYNNDTIECTSTMEDMLSSACHLVSARFRLLDGHRLDFLRFAHDPVFVQLSKIAGKDQNEEVSLFASHARRSLISGTSLGYAARLRLSSRLIINFFVEGESSPDLRCHVRDTVEMAREVIPCMTGTSEGERIALRALVDWVNSLQRLTRYLITV